MVSSFTYVATPFLLDMLSLAAEGCVRNASQHRKPVAVRVWFFTGGMDVYEVYGASFLSVEKHLSADAGTVDNKLDFFFFSRSVSHVIVIRSYEVQDRGRVAEGPDNRIRNLFLIAVGNGEKNSLQSESI